MPRVWYRTGDLVRIVDQGVRKAIGDADDIYWVPKIAGELVTHRQPVRIGPR
jgi:hypothetical protein